MSERLGAVNGLRGVAILAVLVYHLFSRFTDPGGTWQVLVEQGDLGVPLFFVLSGFVLALPYAEGRRRLERERDAWDFYRRRARRLLPLFYLNVLVGFLFVSHPDLLDPRFLHDLFLYATATFPYVPERYYPPPNWVLWSLGIEIGFSLLFPLLLVAVRRIGPGRFLALAAVVALTFRMAGEAHYHGVFLEQPGARLDPIKDSVLGRLDEFAAGVFLAHLHARGRRAGRLALPLFLLGAGLFLGGACLRDRIDAGRLARDWAPFLYLPVTAGFALLLHGGLSLGGLLGRLLRNAPLQLLGMACYSLYVWHGIVFLALLRDPAHYAPRPLAEALLVLLALASLSYRFIEFGHVRDTRRLFRPAPG